MKLTSIALAITAAAAGLSTPLAGKAQPKLEIYGTVDTYLELYNNGASVVFLVSGAEKAEIVKEVLQGPKKYPAQYVQPAIWLLDKAAASKL